MSTVWVANVNEEGVWPVNCVADTLERAQEACVEGLDEEYKIVWEQDDGDERGAWFGYPVLEGARSDVPWFMIEEYGLLTKGA